MADGSIKISIEVDGKQVDVAAKQLDNLEASGNKSGKGVKAAEDSLDSLSDKSAKAGTSVKGAGDSIEGLGESGSKAGQGLKGAEGAIDGVADSSAQAASSVKGAGDTIEGLGSSGDSAASGLQGVDGALDGVADSSAQASESVRGAGDAMADVDGKTNQATGSVKTFAASIGLVAIAAKAFDAMRASVDQAISRFDTLNAFPKVLQALGVSAEDSEAAMAKLSDGIDGLPTKLNDIAATAQRMYTSFGDMDKATDTALALNNALLGSGASADQAKRGTDQYIKALQTGEITMDTWNTLSETMDVGLVKLAEEFGYTGKSAKDDLYNALKDGTVTFDEFNEKLIEVGTGTGIMAELAKENSLGLATSFGNLRNAIANGVAKMIEAFNNLSKAVTGKEIAEHIDSMKVIVNTAFNVMKGAVETTTPVFKFFASVIGGVISTLRPFAPAVMGAATAFGALFVVQKTASMILAFGSALKSSIAVTKAIELATKAYGTAVSIYSGQLTIATMAERAKMLAMAAGSKVLAAATLAYNVLTGRVTLATAAKIAFAAATKALNLAMGLLGGPIGIATVAIGALVGATIGIVKWFNRSTEEGERLKSEVEQMNEKTNSLTDSVESNANAYKDSVSEIKANAEASSELLETVDELSQKENKSAEDKQALMTAVDQLNGSVEGLNLTYDTETDMLSESSEQMQARIDLMKDQETAQQTQERYTEILKDQHTVEEQLSDVLAQQKDVQNDNNITKGEAKDLSADLTEQEEVLRAKLEELGDEQVNVEQTMITAQENIRQTIIDGNAAMLLSYDDLSEGQQEVFNRISDTYSDLKDSASDMFNSIVDEQETSMAEVKANWEENAKVMSEWADNITELAKRGVDEGVLNELRELGPEGALLTKDFVDASDDELKEMEEAYQKTVDATYEATLAQMGEGNEEVLDLVRSLVEDSDMTLEEAVNAAGFEEYGLKLPEDYGEGIEQGTPDVEGAAEQVVDAAYNAMNIAFGNLGFENLGEGGALSVASGIDVGGLTASASGENMALDIFNKVFSNMGSSKYESIGKNVGQGAGAGITGSVINATSAASSLSNDVDSEVSSGMSQSKYGGHGNNVGIGLGNGILAMADYVASAARSVSSGASGAVTSALDIHSPSRVFFGHGRNASQGLGDGITDGRSGVINSILAMTTAMISRTRTGMTDMTNAANNGVSNMDRRLARLSVIANSNMRNMQTKLSNGATNSTAIMARLAVRMISAFSSLPGRMSSVGGNAMSGLNAGLNRGAGRVMSTARSIATRVASTMQRALKIHSPSRLMRDDVGKQIPAGVAVGIEDNAKLVYRALDDLAAGMIKPVSPEVALGTSAMAYNGADSMAQAVRNIKIPENKSAPTSRENNIKVKPSAVYIGEREVGEIVWEVVDEKIRLNNSIVDSFK